MDIGNSSPSIGGVRACCPRKWGENTTAKRKRNTASRVGGGSGGGRRSPSRNQKASAGNRRRKAAVAKSGANTRTRYQGNFLITEKQNANGDGWTVLSLEASPGRNNKVAPNQSGRPKSRRRGKSSPGAPATKKKGATPASQMLANLNAGGAYSNVTPQQKAASRRKYGRGTLAGL